MSMEQIQLRFIIKENSPLENVLKPETRFNPGNAKHAFLTELSLFSSGLFSFERAYGRLSLLLRFLYRMYRNARVSASATPAIAPAGIEMTRGIPANHPRRAPSRTPRRAPAKNAIVAIVITAINSIFSKISIIACTFLIGVPTVQLFTLGQSLEWKANIYITNGTKRQGFLSKMWFYSCFSAFLACL